MCCADTGVPGSCASVAFLYLEPAKNWNSMMNSVIIDPSLSVFKVQGAPAAAAYRAIDCVVGPGHSRSLHLCCAGVSIW